MKLKLIVLLQILSLTLITSASGRMGETEQEAAARYGEPVSEGGEIVKPLLEEARELRYKFQDWRVRCVFIDGRTEVITYMKIEQPVSREALLLKSEVDPILEAESQGGKWTLVEGKQQLTESSQFQAQFDSAKKIWRNDNGFIAWERGGYALSIISPTALAYAVKHQ